VLAGPGATLGIAGCSVFRAAIAPFAPVRSMSAAEVRLVHLLVGRTTA
jgi:hypothetical protein